MAEDPRDFKILGAMQNVSIIAKGHGVRMRDYLQDRHSGRNWRKMKGRAFVEDQYGWIGIAEIHWFEAHGVGRVDWKIKTRFYQ